MTFDPDLDPRQFAPRAFKDAPPLLCTGCGNTPEQIPGYVSFAEDEGLTASEYVWREEGTLNKATGHFLCDACYIRAGQPSGPDGTRWVAP